jgi:D-glycero-D-manno-heptose 1,7-bisphosphate phosphatase
MNFEKAFFFDRDGTLIKDTHYLSSLDAIELLPGIIKLCRAIQVANFRLIVITNQSGVARGIFDESFVHDTHTYLAEIFAKHDVFFDKFYFCPHHPEGTLEKYRCICNCRKPSPGMLLAAAKEFNLDLKKSFMVGDKEVDLQAGIAAGCKSFNINELLGLSNKLLVRLLKDS